MEPIAVSSKLLICGLPIRVDTYSNCSFGCQYCFSNYRVVMPRPSEIKPLSTKKIEKVIKESQSGKEGLIYHLIRDGITLHCGGMSDPLQPAERLFGATKELVRISKDYGISILFSTKSDTLHGIEFDKKLHTFQLSFTNNENNKELERNVALYEDRVKLFCDLKNMGFRVGIRFQPVIPYTFSGDMIDDFSGADHFTFEGLKLVPQNTEQIKKILHITGLRRTDFIQMGLLNLKHQIRFNLYQRILLLMEDGMSWSIADNDMHEWGTNRCCCGDKLISKSTTFNDTNLYQTYGMDYNLKNLLGEANDYLKYDVSSLVTSNRIKGDGTFNSFIKECYFNRASPACKERNYGNLQKQLF